jgi:hypothetical protein
LLLEPKLIACVAIIGGLLIIAFRRELARRGSENQLRIWRFSSSESAVRQSQLMITVTGVAGVLIGLAILVFNLQPR